MDRKTSSRQPPDSHLQHYLEALWNAAREETIFEARDGQFFGAVLGDIQLRKAIVHFAFPGGVREGIHVGVSQAVEQDGVLIHKPVAVGMRAGVEHFADKRIGVIGRLFQQGVVGERNGFAVFYEGSGFAAFGRRDEVRGSDLIVLPPAAPVGKFGHPFFDIGFGGVVGGRVRPLAEQADGYGEKPGKSHRRYSISESGRGVERFGAARQSRSSNGAGFMRREM